MLLLVRIIENLYSKLTVVLETKSCRILPSTYAYEIRLDLVSNLIYDDNAD